jgi:hypothetical protein
MQLRAHTCSINTCTIILIYLLADPKGPIHVDINTCTIILIYLLADPLYELTTLMARSDMAVLFRRQSAGLLAML